MMDKKVIVRKILDSLFQSHQAKGEELLFLLNHLDSENQELLFKYAWETREMSYGNRVFMRGLIEFSNYCRRNCAYCGIRRGNSEADRYRLSLEEILECCVEGYNLGYRTFVLQSGEDLYYSDEILEELILKIKEKYPDVALTLSIGERSFESYQRLYKAGAERYLLRHETASEKLYHELHPYMDLENRRNCLRMLKEIGYQVGAGFMVGLPGQQNEDLVEDLLFLQDLQPEMVGIGPFIPHAKTPLGTCPGGTVEKTLILLALTRLILPEALLPSTTALGTIDPLGREKAIKAGANVVMPNLYPTNVRPKYELYENKICTGDEAAHCRGCIERRILSVGCQVDMGRGDHKKFRQDEN
jgi:biotin synthase